MDKYDKYILAPLPFPENALEPVISAETIGFHYRRHHKGYVDKLNHLIAGTPWEGHSLEDVVRETFQKDTKIFNQAAQVWNHDFYWNSLQAPTPGELRKPSGELKRAIEEKWKSLENFHKEMAAIAAGLFGSGWAWLISDSSGDLSLDVTQNADNPLRKGQIALLAVDVWEHAYYLDYKNERAKYLERLPTILNWEFAQRNFSGREQIAA